jgi:anti-sigma B factor antagonist
VTNFIRERDAGGAVVLEITGRITLGEYSLKFRDCIRDLVAHQRTRIVLDFSQVTYVDSAGVGELVSAYTTVANHGGKITLSHPRLRSMDLMKITKLGGVYEITSSVEEAISGIQSARLTFLCIVSRCETWSPFEAAGPEYQTCTRCGSQSKLALTGAAEAMQSVEVVQVSIPSYGGEYAAVIPGRPCRVEVHGRLDLFALNSARKAASTARAAVFDLSAVTEATPRAWSALFELLAAFDSTAFLPKRSSLTVTPAAGNDILFDDLRQAEEAHFAALERSARRRGTTPTYERRLHTYFLT